MSRSATANARELAASSTSAHIDRYSSTTDAEPTTTKLASTTTAATSAERVAIPPHQRRKRETNAPMRTRPFTIGSTHTSQPLGTASRMATTSHNHCSPTTARRPSAQGQAQPRTGRAPEYVQYPDVPADHRLTCPHHRRHVRRRRPLDLLHAHRSRHHRRRHTHAIETRYVRDRLGHTHHQTHSQPTHRHRTSDLAPPPQQLLHQQWPPPG
ncbi:Uncharacterised protein [Mycobacteroides abscessus subsp. abscessus]|nr:Uncharacterised protein [Mycobacteroides abscessus subsp. abscessus]SHV91699.1 Uncharacterised protein [Mycobacteroides abscessus subsp. abscessus]